MSKRWTWKKQDYSVVDWSNTDASIARELGIAAESVRLARIRHGAVGLKRKPEVSANRCAPIVSPEDQDLLSFTWRLDPDGYPRRSVGAHQQRRSVKLHQAVCLRAFGRMPDWSKREVTDHINRNKLDNRRENLRIVGFSESNKNRVLPKRKAPQPK